MYCKYSSKKHVNHRNQAPLLTLFVSGFEHQSAVWEVSGIDSDALKLLADVIKLLVQLGGVFVESHQLVKRTDLE